MDAKMIVMIVVSFLLLLFSIRLILKGMEIEKESNQRKKAASEKLGKVDQKLDTVLNKMHDSNEMLDAVSDLTKQINKKVMK